MGSSFSEKLRSGDIHPPAAELVGFRMVSFGEGETFTTLEIKVNYLRAVSTCSVLRGEKAEGR